MARRHIARLGCIGAMLFLTEFPASPQANPDVKGATAVLQKFIDLNEQKKLQGAEAKALLSGEALTRWDSPYWGKLADSPDKVLLFGEKSAVGRIQWYGEHEQVTDFYFYLCFDGNWKIEAMRALSLTGIPEMLYLELKKLSKLTEEQQYQMKNLALTLASDAKLHAWFSNNRKGLNNLIKLLDSKAQCGTGYYSEPKCSRGVEEAIRELSLEMIEKHSNGDVFLTIGGMVDNSVGFLFSPKDSPPPISPSEFIWVEKVADGWYLYRTT